jgi:hypothetical protein
MESIPIRMNSEMREQKMSGTSSISIFEEILIKVHFEKKIRI